MRLRQILAAMFIAVFLAGTISYVELNAKPTTVVPPKPKPKPKPKPTRPGPVSSPKPPKPIPPKPKPDPIHNDNKRNESRLYWDASSGDIVHGAHRYKMVYVQGGTFNMGATSEQGSDAETDEKPVHKVTLSDYRIGKTEVPQWLWKAVMGSNPSYFKGDNLPVESVSWNDCQDFIGKLNRLTGQFFMLPTEAQWEFAARGGNNSRGFKYSGGDYPGSVGWYEDNSNNKTHEVGQKSPNELGLYDMSGNVWEWFNDWYGSYSDYSQTNPRGAQTGSRRVFRGGSCSSSARNCRVSFRNFSIPDRRATNVGLRLAL